MVFLFSHAVIRGKISSAYIKTLFHDVTDCDGELFHTCPKSLCVNVLAQMESVILAALKKSAC